MPPTGSQPRRTVAIGDIHGCSGALAALTYRLAPKPSDTFVILGDVVDRGPDSRGAIELLLELRQRCEVVCLLGNHEQMLLEAVDGVFPTHEWLIHGGAETLDSYALGAAPRGIDPRHVDFIRTWQDYWEGDSHFFVHGGYAAEHSFAEQPWHDLRWQSLKYLLPGPHASGKTAVVGHTANKWGNIVNLGHLVCIDTYCYGGGWLTALDVGAGEVWQTRSDGMIRRGALPPPTEHFQPDA